MTSAPQSTAAQAVSGDHVSIEKGIIHPETDDFEKIHRQLEIVWQADRLRALGCPLLFYAARKPERLARIMMASSVLHARADYIRTHDPSTLRALLRHNAAETS